ncbi:MAG: 2-C-methyl-D-erythritol 2,4-cyclodiphosphate synthase [Rickettsiales bacterium]|nr:2-C-methyl-D-erythritol 2,4-cyclodiphosphate synthase [Rickettsiales bacterium]
MPNSVEYFVGMGFDVHKYDETNNVPAVSIPICGVHVPYTRHVLAHSDGDVGLHALADAMLGAIGMGDIGIHFPPSNSKWQDVNSMVFIEHILILFDEHNYHMVNADITIICQRPIIKDYNQAMRIVLAEALKLPERRVNIKATTTERLGFLGREEGIAAQAVVNVKQIGTDDD